MRPLAFSLANASLPLLLRVEPELAHRTAMAGLKLLRPLLPPLKPSDGLSVTCAGLRFGHPVGIAAGFDKNGDYLDVLGALGFSHVEVGTVTPKPQPGNPRPRIFRVRAAQALVNRMGFNNNGVDYVVQRLQRSSFRGIRGISIGKNATTSIEKAVEDYLYCFRGVYASADYIAVNVSSPNTANLRALQTTERLSALIGVLQEERVRLARTYGKEVPIFIKIAPDLSPLQLSSLVSEMRRLGLDGIIATNTTVEFDGIASIPAFWAGGGLSGSPLHERSLSVIAQLRAELGSGFPIIGVGGIGNAPAALATLRAGANVIQLYTGFVYRGPELLYDIIHALEGRRDMGGLHAVNGDRDLNRS